MGGRGSYAAGKNPDFTYKTVGSVNGVKVLVGIGTSHGLPVESHGSEAYIKLKPNGTFHEMRIYDKDKYMTLEIGYHPEPNLNNGDMRTPILHAHDLKIRNDFSIPSRTTRLLTKDEFKRFRKFFIGVSL